MFVLHSFCTYSQIDFISQEMDPPEAVYLHCKYNICNVNLNTERIQFKLNFLVQLTVYFHCRLS